jgi:mannose-6-phosphate isomerase-like protein (cupin superfamily)
VVFQPWYQFAEGGPVEQATLPFPALQPAAIEVARWIVAAGTANHVDVHNSREVWVVVSGQATVTWGEGHKRRTGPCDVMAFDSRTPHQLRNDGDEALVAVSVYWLDAAVRAQRAADR